MVRRGNSLVLPQTPLIRISGVGPGSGDYNVLPGRKPLAQFSLPPSAFDMKCEKAVGRKGREVHIGPQDGLVTRLKRFGHLSWIVHWCPANWLLSSR